MTNVITEFEKNEVIDLINEAANLLGSHSAVATKCGISPATISLMVKNEYTTKGEDMWLKVAAALGWRPKGWKIADTTNTKAVSQVLTSAQNQSMFIRISEKAGSGKSTAINNYCAKNNNCYRITCRDWSKREFLLKLCRSLGITIQGGYQSQDMILEQVINFFTTRKGKPLLIIDQANSLKPSVLGFLIHLFNECEDKLGVVICGTEHLRIDFERGVKYSRKGYDELDSRFGRSFITLVGNTITDVRKICEANGIADRAVQDKIFKDCNPVHKSIVQDNHTTNLTVVLDGRAIKRAVTKHHLLAAISSGELNSPN
jgi:hypothetical protein